MAYKGYAIIFILFYSLLYISVKAAGQSGNSDFCKKLLQILSFVSERHQSDTSVNAPLGSVRTASKVIPAAKSNHRVVYYTNTIELPGLTISEFKKENGKFDFTGIFGSKANKDYGISVNFSDQFNMGNEDAVNSFIVTDIIATLKAGARNTSKLEGHSITAYSKDGSMEAN